MMTNSWKTVGALFWAFFKMGPSTFGGGFAMVPLIEREIVERRKWLAQEDVTDVLALAQVVPGAVAVNSATLIGHRVAGVRGALAALIGISLPTFVIILAAGILFVTAKDHPKVEAALLGMRPAIVAIIAYAGIKVAKNALIDRFSMLLLVTGFGLLFWIHPVLVILFGAAAGVAFSAWLKKHGRTGKEPKQRSMDPDYFMGDGI